MKNITLSADETLIERARDKARREHTTFNMEFRRWLERYTASDQRATDYRELMKTLATVDSGRTFTRDEMNER